MSNPSDVNLFELWFQIEVTDPEYASGESIAGFIRTVTQYIPVQKVAIAGAAWLAYAMGMPVSQGSSVMTVTVDVFLNGIIGITQVDWADFFFYLADDIVPEDIGEMNFTSALTDSRFCVSVADNTYLVLYTKNPELTSAIGTQYDEVEIKTCALAQLSHYF